MMVTDTEIYSWFKELGMKLEKVTSGGIYFHFTVSPPTGGLPVSIIRTSPDTTYYIVAVILDLDQEKLKSNPTVISAIKKELLKLNVEFFFSPDEKSPRSIQIARILFSEGLTKNEALNTVTLIKNSALLTLELQKGF